MGQREGNTTSAAKEPVACDRGGLDHKPSTFALPRKWVGWSPCPWISASISKIITAYFEKWKLFHSRLWTIPHNFWLINVKIIGCLVLAPWNKKLVVVRLKRVVGLVDGKIIDQAEGATTLTRIPSSYCWPHSSCWAEHPFCEVKHTLIPPGKFSLLCRRLL